MLLRLLLHGADREGLSSLYTAFDGAICENASLTRLNYLAVSCAFLALHFPVFRKSRAKPISFFKGAKRISAVERTEYQIPSLPTSTYLLSSELIIIIISTLIL